MKLEVFSADVLHGFFIPAFRLKIDAVPGRTNITWFQPTQLGSFDIECTVICGVNHSAMLTTVEVVTEEAFKAWYFGAEGTPEPSAVHASAASANTSEPAGLAAMRPKGCLNCHSIDGRPMVGPTFKGMYGKQEEVLSNGKPYTIVLDDRRLRLAIENPGQEVALGYPAIMPSVILRPGELDSVIAYLRILH
jgi:cytochrome c oxidase subunit 2